MKGYHYFKAPYICWTNEHDEVIISDSADNHLMVFNDTTQTDLNDAASLQEELIMWQEFGQFVADALNEKVAREKH